MSPFLFKKSRDLLLTLAFLFGCTAAKSHSVGYSMGEGQQARGQTWYMQREEDRIMGADPASQ